MIKLKLDDIVNSASSELEEYETKLLLTRKEMEKNKPKKGSLVYQQLLIRQSMLQGYICCLKGENL